MDTDKHCVVCGMYLVNDSNDAIYVKRMRQREIVFIYINKNR